MATPFSLSTLFPNFSFLLTIRALPFTFTGISDALSWLSLLLLLLINAVSKLDMTTNQNWRHTQEYTIFFLLSSCLRWMCNIIIIYFCRGFRQILHVSTTTIIHHHQLSINIQHCVCCYNGGIVHERSFCSLMDSSLNWIAINSWSHTETTKRRRRPASEQKDEKWKKKEEKKGFSAE